MGHELALLNEALQWLRNFSPEASRKLIDWVTGKLIDSGLGFVSRAVRRCLNKHADSAEEMRLAIERIQSTLSSLQVEVESIKGGDESGPAPFDPAFQSFCDEALEAAVETPNEGKHIVLGRLIGQRLTAETESDEDLTLRQAMRILRLSNRRHLFAIGTLYLVTNPPESVMQIETVYRWWDECFLPLLMEWLREPWGWTELEYLEYLGALRKDPLVAQSYQAGIPDRGSHVDALLQRRGVGVQTFGNLNRPRSEFVEFLRAVESKSRTIAGYPEHDALGPYSLSPAGSIIGRSLVEGLTGLSIDEMKRASTWPLN